MKGVGGLVVRGRVVVGMVEVAEDCWGGGVVVVVLVVLVVGLVVLWRMSRMMSAVFKLRICGLRLGFMEML